MLTGKAGRNFTIVMLVVWGLLVSFSANAFGAGEYDGVWVGLQDIWVPGYLSETETTGTVIYQPDDNTLNLWDPLYGSVDLVRSGNQWILPAPISTTYLGQTATISSFVISSLTSTHLVGAIEVTVSGVNGEATLNHYKQQCPTLVQGTTVPGITGARDGILCYELSLPPHSTDLDVQTSDGEGDCDLIVIYSRPDFYNDISENNFTAEQVTIDAPASGKWYIGLLGTKGFSGVSLVADYIGLPAAVADFSGSPTIGHTPLMVSFTDESSGSISSWSWDFGDGSISTNQNPVHSYSAPGAYTVSLSIDGPGGPSMNIKNGYIEVSGVQASGKAMPWLPLLLLDKE